MPSVTASELGKAHLRSDGPFGGLLHCKVNRRFFDAGCAKVAWNGTPQSVIVAYRPRNAASEYLSGSVRVGLFGTAALRGRCTPPKADGKYRRKTDSEQVE